MLAVANFSFARTYVNDKQDCKIRKELFTKSFGRTYVNGKPRANSSTGKASEKSLKMLLVRVYYAKMVVMMRLYYVLSNINRPIHRRSPSI